MWDVSGSISNTFGLLVRNENIWEVLGESLASRKPGTYVYVLLLCAVFAYLTRHLS